MEILKQNGWNIKEISNSGNQIVNLMAKLKNFRVCIQCKDHIKIIEKKAVQKIPLENFIRKEFMGTNFKIRFTKS